MELTDSEQEDLRTVLVHIFGSEASSWEMNQGTLRATAEMLEATKKCSQAMDYVPRPTYGADLSYFRRQLRDMARRAHSHDKMYESCKSVGSAKWKSEIAIATMYGH